MSVTDNSLVAGTVPVIENSFCEIGESFNLLTKETGKLSSKLSS